MKRFHLRPLLFVLAALLLIGGVAALPIVRELQQEAKDRALIAAIKKNDGPAVVRLLAEGADANARDPNGGTALQDAALWADVSSVRLLLAYHANVAIKDSNGNTAMDLAIYGTSIPAIDEATLSNYAEIMYLLRQAGAR